MNQILDSLNKEINSAILEGKSKLVTSFDSLEAFQAKQIRQYLLQEGFTKYKFKDVSFVYDFTELEIWLYEKA